MQRRGGDGNLSVVEPVTGSSLVETINAENWGLGMLKHGRRKAAGQMDVGRPGWTRWKWADLGGDEDTVRRLGSGCDQAFRGGARQVRFSDVVECFEVPGQVDTYGFDVRAFDMWPRGPLRIRRFRREVSELVA